jgi:TolB-like protein/Tfp pilus assembly protein PilF
MSFLTELKRRNVFKVAGAYLALGWVVVQATATLAPALNLPESVLPLVTWIGVIGFPFALVFSWAYELTPDGLKRESEVDRSQSITHVTSRRLDYIIIALLVLAMLMFAADRLVSRNSGVESAADPGQGALPPQASSPGTNRKSIAVLPFESLSSDAENEHFADGLHDELLTKLAKLHDLKVISRTSVMEYRDKAHNLREIGKALGVATILEGTVRKADNRVRLSMQLIDSETDAHLWAETYERELTDVFQIQTAVADEIAQALKLNFSAEERRAVDQQASANPEAYDLYLRARRYGDYWARENDDLRKARELLERAVALDPGFAEAHGRLAVVAAVQYDRNDHTAERLAQSERAIARALDLDPQLPSAHFAKAHNEYWAHQRFEVALTDLDRALAREPNYAEALTMRGFLYRRLGRWDEMLAAFARAVELNPRHPDVLQSAGLAAAYLRRYAEAAQFYDRAVAAAPDDLDYAADRAFHEINWRGDLAMLREVVRRADGTDLRTRRQWAWLLAGYDGRLDDLDAIVAQWSPEMLEVGSGLTLQRSGFTAYNAWLRGDREDTRSAAAEPRRDLERQLAGRPDADQFAFARAIMAALDGDAPAARRWLDAEERYARRINDAVRLKGTAYSRMQVMLLLGENIAALDLLERALADPVGGREVADAAQVAIDPLWKNLRDDSRFKAIIAQHWPKD